MKDWSIAYIEHVLAEKGWTVADLAHHAGVAHSTINRPLTKPDWKSVLSRKTLAAIIRASGIDPAPFAPTTQGLSSMADAVSLPSVPLPDLVPVYDIQVAAGPGIIPDAYEAVVDRLAFPPGYVAGLTGTNRKQLAIVGVVGTSMEPTLHHGDLVMVDMTKTDINFDGMFVIRVGESLKVKRISWGPRRRSVIVRSDNPNKLQHPDEEFFEEDSVQVVGRVIWVGAKQT